MLSTDMLIEASEAQRTLIDKSWQVSYKLRVINSPAGAHSPDQHSSLSYTSAALSTQLAQLERRGLDQAGLITLGRSLAALLLPAGEDHNSIYDLFLRSMDLIGPEGGLRLRLRLPPLLSVLPWEYVYVDRVGNPDSMDGFLSLNPRVTIIRDEVQPTPSTLEPLSGPIKIVAAFATPEGMPELNLEQEKHNLHAALDNQPGLLPTYLEQATLDELLTAIHSAGVFHFAGHGQFVRQPGDLPGTYSGQAGLALFDRYVEAEQLAINLSRGGVRLAVLGGCETARRDQVNVWSGIASTLVRAHTQIPAVVANQYSITDDSAIAFSKHFYQALVAGLSIEEAVSVGRIAAYNAYPTGRDWGVPVLYMRPGDGHLFVGAADATLRESTRQSAELSVKLRAQQVAHGGFLTGAQIKTMRAGSLNIDITLGTVSGTVVGAEIDSVQGGTADVQLDIDKVDEKGHITGLQIDEL